MLQSDASLQGWALAHSFWSRETVVQVGRSLERSRFRRVGPHSARESAPVSAVLEVKSDGNWRPKEVPWSLLRRSRWKHVRKGMWRFNEDISMVEASDCATIWASCLLLNPAVLATLEF